MKVKDLIKKLQKQDPEAIVMIEQGELANYMTAQAVKERELVLIDDDKEVTAVVIEYS